jgi:hypothetical protein
MALAILSTACSSLGESVRRRAASSHLGAQKAQLRGVRVRELQVVYAHDADATRIDDLLVQEVACNQHLVRLEIAEADIGLDDLQAHFVLVIRVDILAPREHETGCGWGLRLRAR